MDRKEKNKLISQMTPSIFWDVDISKLDAIEDKNYIIERVYSRGYEKDEILLWKLYSYREIKKAVVKLEELNERAAAYLSQIFNIKESKFKCYTGKPYLLNCSTE